jgi:UPF0716 protein FxsA
MRILFLLFIVVPIIEMWLLITVGQHIGALATIGLVLLTAFIGISLLRYQGAMTLLKARMKMNAGEIPAREMADGLFFAVGGALLLTPGFVTDIIGFACLTPGIRTVLIAFFAKHLFRGKFQVHSSASFAADQKTHVVDVIEGDFERHKD